MEGRMPDAIRERRPVEMDALVGMDLGLPMQRQMIGIFRHQHLGNGCLGRQTALDQPGWSFGLPDVVFTGATGVFGSRVTTTRNCAGIMSSRSLRFSHLVQVALAAWTALAVDVDQDLDPR